MLHKSAFEELKLMIDRAVDREELEDIRQMILETHDLQFSEKERLSNYLNERYQTALELRKR